MVIIIFTNCYLPTYSIELSKLLFLLWRYAL